MYAFISAAVCTSRRSVIAHTVTSPLTTELLKGYRKPLQLSIHCLQEPLFLDTLQALSKNYFACLLRDAAVFAR